MHKVVMQVLSAGEFKCNIVLIFFFLKNPMDIILVGKKLPNRTKIADIEVTASHLELPKLIF